VCYLSRIADSSSINAVSFSSARATKRFPPPPRRVPRPAIFQFSKFCSLNRWIQTALSNSINAVSISSACTTNRFPSPRCASTIQIVRPLESIAETQPQLHPALLRLSAIISQFFTRSDRASLVQESGKYSVLLFLAEFLEARVGAQRIPNWIEFQELRSESIGPV